MGKYFIAQGQVTPKKVIWDFIAVLITCKFGEHRIKNEVSIDQTRSIMGFFGSQGK